MKEKRYIQLLFIFIALCCAAFKSSAQHSFPSGNNAALNTFQDSLVRLSKAMQDTSSQEIRLQKNADFVRTLVNALKTPNSFKYPFDSLKNVSILRPADNTFRIFTWFIPLDNGSYRFFGTIQMYTPDGKLKLHPLIDNTANISDINEVTSNLKWFGARYYEIIPVIINGKLPYYVLLGWKGNTPHTTKKVIEILHFEKGQALFGKAVFDGKDSKGKNRIVFEYNKLNAMTLKMEKSLNMIVFDHLSPYDPKMEGNFAYYGSDFSFDAYKIIGGRLRLQEDVDVRNDANQNDALYVNPKDKNIRPARKF